MTCNLSRAGNLRWKLSFWISFWTQSSLLAYSGLLYPCVYVRRNIRASAMSSVPACSHRLVLSSITGTRALRSLYNDISCLLFEVDANLWRMRCEKSSLFFFFNCSLSLCFIGYVLFIEIGQVSVQDVHRSEAQQCLINSIWFFCV